MRHDLKVCHKMEKRRPNIQTSSSSEDEEDERLRLAVDPNFFIDSKRDTVDDKQNGSWKPPLPTNRNEKANTCYATKTRTDPLQTEWEAGHFVHPIKLSEESKDFVFKKLSEILEAQIKVKKRKVIQHDEDDESGILLFSSSREVITARDVREQTQPNKSRKHIKRKKKVAKDSSDSEDDDKFKAAAVSADWVLSDKTV